MARVLAALAVLAAWLGSTQGQFSLTPRYFNIAENRPIMANATCGEGVMVQEEYCKLVGGGFSSSGFGSSQSSNFKDGQVCDFCLPRGTDPAADQSKIHGAESAVDGDITTWWQSPPLSRGRKYNYVDLEINLLQSFQVAYVVVTMADSPRPGVWALEKSMDNGVTWTAWQYFASNDGECQRFFNMHARRSEDPIRADNEVTCTTEYSKVLPVEGGEIFVALTTGRPSQHNIQESEVMLDWLTATNVRLRLMQTKTMLGHLMSVAQGDNTVTRRYYYAIKEISIGGRCVCNGHAYICPSSPLDPDILQCDCQHGTTGINCDECLDGYTQKAWRRYTRSDPFECERCNCHGHTDKCHYNETVAAMGLSMDIHGEYLGGGQCDECQDFTTGVNCDACVDGHFRPPGVLANDTTPCVPCDCKDDARYTGSCAAEDGQCECTPPFRGAEDCSVCAQGYFGYPDCLECPCTTEGTRLDDTGIPVCVSESPDGTTELQCPCKDNFGGDLCGQCDDGYYNFPECTPCDCHPDHAENDVCNLDDGQCSCKAQYGGRACEECTHGHFNYPDCASLNSEPENLRALVSKMDRKALDDMVARLLIKLKECFNKT